MGECVGWLERIIARDQSFSTFSYFFFFLFLPLPPLCIPPFPPLVHWTHTFQRLYASSGPLACVSCFKTLISRIYQSEAVSAYRLLINAGSTTSRVIVYLALDCFNMSRMRDVHTFAKVAMYHGEDADTFFFRYRLLALQPSEVLPINISYKDLLTNQPKQLIPNIILRTCPILDSLLG
ncbi:hypothetical protein NPIL_602201 [Nephila pilipes]|uniref:Uncharacterized protein n=1 Tax=Nephila pilipes TaxID=299642 RepID=A0A8X6NI50_NEPPI|nr:hypothetical protein NPIL_602201 [Nephila pilipes]